ncbi:hypothetical protein [Streptomyces sp. AK08-02]|uniref:NACHT domain-containing protein n=1 Tax=Streptomyces sp. AK08-02 TaxID=3028654 RepID=UPI0029B3E41F|nr:hypothetical protein [Streptomyces sp. AK08-02]MDX3751244.1 hypothetical protein [Streptomyces sp. AK08-02]
MVDALDELPDRSEQRALLTRLVHFAGEYRDRISLVITTRTLEQEGEAEALMKLGCELGVLQPFDSGRVDRFAAAWFPESPYLQALLARWWETLRRGGLEPTPFLVTLTAGLLEADPRRQLAAHTHVLIEQYRAELRGFRARRTARHFRRLECEPGKTDDVLRTLRSLSEYLDVLVGRMAVAHVHDGVTDLFRHALQLLDEEWGPRSALSVPGWADRVRTALVDTGYFTDDARLRFTHRRFAEHLAAEHLAQTVPVQFDSGDSAWHIRLWSAMRDYRWFDVLTHYGYQAPAGGRALLSWLQQGSHPWRRIAALLIAFGVPHEDGHIDSFVDSLNTLPSLHRDEWWSLARALPYEAVHRYVLRIALSDVTTATEPALRQLFRFDPARARSRVLELLAEAHDPMVRSHLAALAAELAPEDSLVAQTLSRCLTDDDLSASVRVDLAGSLGEIAPEDGAPVAFLREVARGYVSPRSLGSDHIAVDDIRFRAARRLAFLRTDSFDDDVDLMTAMLEASRGDTDLWLWRLRELYDLAPNRLSRIQAMVRHRMAEHSQSSALYESFLTALKTGADSWRDPDPPVLSELPDAVRAALESGKRTEAELAQVIEAHLTNPDLFDRKRAVAELCRYDPPVPRLTQDVLLRQIRNPDRCATWQTADVTADCAALLIRMSDDHLAEAAEALVAATAEHDIVGAVLRGSERIVLLASVAPQYVPLAAQILRTDLPKTVNDLASLGPAHAQEAGHQLVQELVRTLHSGDEGRRSRAASQLSGLGPDVEPTAVAALVSVIGTPERDTMRIGGQARQDAIRALRRMGAVYHGELAAALAEYAAESNEDNGLFGLSDEDLMHCVNDEGVIVRALRLTAERGSAHPSARLEAARRLLDAHKHTAVARDCLRGLVVDNLVPARTRATGVDLLLSHDPETAAACQRDLAALAGNRGRSDTERVVATLLEARFASHDRAADGPAFDPARSRSLASWAQNPHACLLMARMVAETMPGRKELAGSLAHMAVQTLHPGSLSQLEAIRVMMSLGGHFAQQAARHLVAVPGPALRDYPDTFPEVLRACPDDDVEVVLDTLAALPTTVADRLRILRHLMASCLAHEVRGEPWQDLLSVPAVNEEVAYYGWITGLLPIADVLPVFEELAAGHNSDGTEASEEDEENRICARAALLCHRPSALSPQERVDAVNGLLNILGAALPRPTFDVVHDIVRTLKDCGLPNVRDVLCSVLYGVLTDPDIASNGESAAMQKTVRLVYARLLTDEVYPDDVIAQIEQDLSDPFLPPRAGASLREALPIVRSVRVPLDRVIKRLNLT